MIFYRILLTIAALVAGTFLFFFIWGTSDGTVDADNILLWLAILGGLGAILIGAIKLKAGGHLLPACVLLLLPALPALLFALFLLLAITLDVRWN